MGAIIAMAERQAVRHRKFEPTSNIKKSRFFEMVHRAKEYITAGDIFQVVLSQRFTIPFSLPSLALYRSLRRLLRRIHQILKLLGFE